MTLPALPIFVKLAGRPVMLIGEGEAAQAKRRLLERAGATIVGEGDPASIALIASEDPEPVAARLRARGVLVNVADRPELCDFILPAIVDRAPVIVAVGTGGASAGLAAALRQRLEAMLPSDLGKLAEAMAAARPKLRERWPDGGARRRAIGAALAASIDPQEVMALLEAAPPRPALVRMRLASADPDDLTLRQARALAQAERVFHRPDVPPAILDRARADAPRIVCAAPPADRGEGLSVDLEMVG